MIDILFGIYLIIGVLVCLYAIFVMGWGSGDAFTFLMCCIVGVFAICWWGPMLALWLAGSIVLGSIQWVMDIPARRQMSTATARYLKKREQYRALLTSKLD